MPMTLNEPADLASDVGRNLQRMVGVRSCYIEIDQRALDALTGQRDEAAAF